MDVEQHHLRAGRSDNGECLRRSGRLADDLAVSGQLGAANLTAESLETSASVKLEKVEGGFAITAIHLVTRANIPGATEEAFNTAAQNAKNGCPISKLFKGNAEITLDAKLV